MNRGFSTNCADLSRSAGMPQAASREQLIAGLREQLGQWGEAAQASDPDVFTCGAAAVDQLLPSGGLRHGMVVEWINAPLAAGGSPAGKTASTKLGEMKKAAGGPPVATSGAATLALLSAREACREGGVLVVIDRARTFYPPAAAAWGIDLGRLIVVWPQSARDETWAAVQALRSPVVAAVWAPIERLDSRAFRRLQLAAEVGRTLGVLVRPASARGQPSWADVRLEVGAGGWGSGTRDNFGLRISDNALKHSSRNPKSAIRNRSARFVAVQVAHCRGGRAGGTAIVEIDDVHHTMREVSSTHDTHPLPVVAKLGDSTSHSHSARA